MKKALAAKAVVWAVLGCVGPGAMAEVQGGRYRQLQVAPSAADPAVRNADTPSRIYYDPAVKGNRILLWLTGTGGSPAHGPDAFFQTALAQGYRVISLSFISTPAVAQVCRGEMLRAAPDCAAQFRQRRLYGDNRFDRIDDQPQDAIVPRLAALLRYLDRTDPAGDWSQYLQGGAVRWPQIAAAGQSQGGGMAEYLGKREHLDRILSFSGGWDFSAPRRIADWYSEESVTPPDRWYATYNVRENAADPLAQSYRAMRIPQAQVYALDQPLANPGRSASPNPYHVEGIHNPVYQPVWRAMLGSGLAAP